MSKVAVVYWSGTGNTETMANAVAEGIQGKGALSGKKIALFGSYGWGDGEWMRLWEDEARDAGADLVVESVMANNEPDDDAIEACKALGAALA